MFCMTRAFRAVIAALLVGAVAQAQFPHLYSFGSNDLVHPHDVAVYAPGDIKRYVFVTDGGTGDLVRFRYSGDNVLAPLHIATGANSSTGGVLQAVAVNAIPGHCNQGQVYVTQVFGPGAPGNPPNLRVLVYDITGAMKMELVPILGDTFYALTGQGMACDSKGNVYITDTSRHRVLKYNAAVFDPSHYYTSWILAPDQVFSGVGAPEDVSVDVEGTVYVSDRQFGLVAAFNPNGTAAGVLNPDPPVATLWGVDATDPLREVWLNHGSVEHYTDPLSVQPTRDVTTTDSGIILGYRVTYQKFLVNFYGPFYSQLRSQERVFVVDSGNGASGKIDVFGENTVATGVPSGAVAWWKFSEGHDACAGTSALVRDSLGSNHGVITGSLPQPETCEGAVGPALRFGGAGDRVQVPDAPALNFGAGSFTIEGWVRTVASGSVVTLLDKRTGEGAGYHVFVYGGNISIQVNGGGAVYQNWPIPNGFVADGGWHHFAFSVDRTAGGILGMVDGVATTTTLNPALAGLSTSNNAALLIGAHNSSTLHFPGSVDELTLYNRALSATELQTIWAARYAGKRRFNFLLF